MLEGEYLELVNDLKKRFDEKEKEMERIEEENTDLKKLFYSVYGFVRIIDITDDYSDKESMLEILRSFLSERYDMLNG